MKLLPLFPLKTFMAGQNLQNWFQGHKSAFFPDCQLFCLKQLSFVSTLASLSINFWVSSSWTWVQQCTFLRWRGIWAPWSMDKKVDKESEVIDSSLNLLLLQSRKRKNPLILETSVSLYLNRMIIIILISKHFWKDEIKLWI